MCGIAGYNLKPEFAETLTVEQQFNMLEISWMYNLHRGTDAAGFFCVPATEDTTYYWKQGESAQALLPGLEKDIMPVSRVVGAHTRASTLGPASINENNHPVIEDGVFVTHNGHVSNHQAIRGTNPKHPLVDSHAIAYLLNGVENPFDIEQLLEAVKKLRGGWAIHAVWVNHPGYSVLGRGQNSPLIVRYHEDYGVVYSSEPDAGLRLIQEMGLNPNDWNTGELDDHCIFTVLNGQPLDWRAFIMPPDTNTNQHGPVLATRIDPEMGQVYSTDYTKDFGNYPRHELADCDPTKSTVVWDRSDVTMGVNKLPFATDSTLASRAVEADKITQNDGMTFIQLGNYEIVVETYGSKILDIINRDKPGSRWEHTTAPGYKSVDHVESTFADYMESRSSWVKDDEGVPEPQAMRQIKTYGSMLFGDYWDDDLMVGNWEVEDDLEKGEMVTPFNYSQLWKNKQDNLFIFRDCTKCMLHSTYPDVHKNIADCPEMIERTLEVYACIDDLDLVMKGSKDMKLLPTHYEWGHDPCQNKCNWFIKYYHHIAYGDKEFMIPFGAQCEDCESLKWTDLPKFMQEIESYKENKIVMVGDK